MSESEKDFSDRLTKAERAISEVAELKKSIAAKDVLIAGLEENIGKVAEGFKTLITRQQVMRKSLTGITFVDKPGSVAPTAGAADFSSMSKSEVVQKLSEVTASPNLSSQDRSLINRFMVGNSPVSTVAKFLQ